jgi:hypothetical protein
MAGALMERNQRFLSTLPAGRGQRRPALAVPFLAKPGDLGQMRQLVHPDAGHRDGGRPTEQAIR